jgi:hypothetical protein
MIDPSSQMLFPFAESKPVSPKPPLVPAKTLYESVRIDNASLPHNQRVVIKDPACKFCEDRFANLTAHGQARLLADVALKLQENLSMGTKPPLLLSALRAKLGLPNDAVISHEVATTFFLDFPPTQMGLFLSREIRQPDIRGFVLERFFDELRTQLPAVSFTLAHLYTGGFYGLLTARGGRDKEHRAQLQAIGQILGHTPIAELTYYVNDQQLSKRFAGKFSGTAARKAAVLTNFACGLKENEEGFVVPMSIGKRFDEVIFIDDEDKNLKQVLRCLIRGVCTHVFDKIGWVYRTPEMETLLNDRADALTEKEFSANKVARTGELSFWRSLVDNLLSEYTRHTGEYQDREKLIADLIAEKRWMPDAIKVYDGRSVGIEQSIQTLRTIFEGNEPIVMGSKRSVVFNDIDRTILAVDAKFYVIDKTNPTGEAVLIFSQEDFAREQSEAVWIATAAEQSGIAPENLEVSWTHFRDEEQIEIDHLVAYYKGQITKNPHSL